MEIFSEVLDTEPEFPPNEKDAWNPLHERCAASQLRRALEWPIVVVEKEENLSAFSEN